MNKPVYEKNLEALGKKYPVWAEIIKTNNRKKRNFDVIIENSYTDEPIMKVRDHNVTWYLNGRYAPSAVVERWLMQQGEIDKFATIIIIGISNGIHIKKIMERVPKTVNILVYEPSYEIFRRAVEEVDLTFLFQPDIPVGLLVPLINGFELYKFLNYFITYDNLVSLKIYLSGNYQNLFHDEVGTFLKTIKEYVDTITVSWQTQIRYTNVNAQNIFHNLKYLYKGYSVADLKGILPSDIPVIVVSAGPSLNKNLKDLKAAEGKACIIATDTAMKPLLNEGIVPDLFMIVDGLKPAELFEHKDISKAGMVTMTAVSKEPMDLHKGKKFFYSSESLYEEELTREISVMKKRNVVPPAIPTGGSVATSAYSLGEYMGARTIILVGQDLALTGNKVHVDGAFQNETCEINMDNGAFMEIEAIDGGTVITRNDFKFYLEWFERTIKDWKHVTTIDATEGGALIHGAKIMTLKKAIKKYCIKPYNTKWHISRLKKIFQTVEEREYALQYFEKSAKKLEDIGKKALEGIQYYEKLQKMTEKQFGSRKQFQNIYKKIKKINNFMEKDAMAEMVMDSLKGVQYTLRPTIYKVQNENQDEVNDIAEQGKIMLVAIYHAAAELKDVAEKSLLPYVKKQLQEKEMEV